MSWIIFYTLLYIMNFLISSFFSFMKHPLAMGLTLLMQTIFVCLITGLYTKSFWFSYILFLIFLGGMLVLFIYMTSLASNEMFNLKILPIYLCLFLTLIFMMSMIFIDKTIFFINFTNNESSSLSSFKTLLLENTIMLNKIYNFPINLITILLMIYLFLTLIAAVKITNIFEGPLRPKT